MIKDGNIASISIGNNAETPDKGGVAIAQLPEQIVAAQSYDVDILLFLANNPCFDTATDIIEVRYLSKSQVSSSIKLLEQCGYLRKEYLKGNRKTAQEKFISIMLDGFSQEEIDGMKQYNDRILCNINAYLKGNEVE